MDTTNTNNKVACALRKVANQIELLDTLEEEGGVIKINTIDEWLQLALMGYETTAGVAECFGKPIVFNGNVGKLVQIIIDLLGDLKKTDVKATA